MPRLSPPVTCSELLFSILEDWWNPIYFFSDIPLWNLPDSANACALLPGRQDCPSLYTTFARDVASDLSVSLPHEPFCGLWQKLTERLRMNTEHLLSGIHCFSRVSYFSRYPLLPQWQGLPFFSFLHCQMRSPYSQALFREVTTNQPNQSQIWWSYPQRRQLFTLLWSPEIQKSTDTV